MGDGEQQWLQKIPDSVQKAQPYSEEKKKDQRREDAHYRTGVTSNVKKKKKTTFAGPPKFTHPDSHQKEKGRERKWKYLEIPITF